MLQVSEIVNIIITKQSEVAYNFGFFDDTGFVLTGIIALVVAVVALVVTVVLVLAAVIAVV